MIIHCFFCNVRDDVIADQKMQLLTALARFSEMLDSVINVDFGPNRDFEKKTESYDHGFIMRFASRQALEAYAVHLTHKELGGCLVDLVEDGADGMVVFDLEVA